jgi:galactokinase
LRALGAGELDAALAGLGEDELRRYTRHVVTENERVLRAVELLRAGRLREVGPLLSASHASLRDDFRVSIPELDVAAGTLVAVGAAGARLVGGGFGGCVLAVLDAGLVPAATSAVTEAYARRGWCEPVCFTVRPSPGARKL